MMMKKKKKSNRENSFGYQNHKTREIHMPKLKRTQTQHSTTMNVLSFCAFLCSQCNRRSMLFSAERIEASSFFFSQSLLLHYSTFYPHHFMNFLSFDSQIVDSRSHTVSRSVSASQFRSCVCFCAFLRAIIPFSFHMQEMRIHSKPSEHLLSFQF